MKKYHSHIFIPLPDKKVSIKNNATPITHFMLCLALLLSSILLNAQKQQGFDAGLLMGLNAAQIDGDGMDGFNKIGLRTGVYVQREFKKNWSYRIEMLYTQKGSKRLYNENGPIGGYWDIAKTDYIEVPLLLQYRTKKKLQIQAGLSAGYLLKHYVYNDYDGEIPSDFFKKSDFSFLAGAAYPINKKWSVEARYQQSIASILETSYLLYIGRSHVLIHKLIGMQLVYRLQ